MITVLVLLFLQQGQPEDFDHTRLPGYQTFKDTISEIDPKQGTYILVHESCSPEYLERLFHIAKAYVPKQKRTNLQLVAEEEYVRKFLERQFGLTLLYLREDATDRLLYRKLEPEDPTVRAIIFSCLEKINNLNHVPSISDRIWTSIVVVLQRDQGDLIFGEFP